MAPEPTPSPSEFGRALQEVTELTQKIVHEEIELAKAEVSAKASKLAKGAAIGVAAGVFLIGVLIYGLHSMSWFFFDLTNNSSDDNIWLGFLITTFILLVFAVVAGLLAYRFVKGGSPPTPQMAIDEAQKVRATLTESGKS
jgi:H+/Cl- antiporter ClcA